ncbi:hypothetical protein WJX81_004387 [Elliptochloris bilobata]|uniref:K Homology domain-containing protein n=1 Tax=Elliptochloris bilobata TaxID=381761 RepID=A0AAW1REJ9_9CHLO
MVFSFYRDLRRELDFCDAGGEARAHLARPEVGASDSVCLVGETSGRIKWIQPSGPRRPGEGTEDEEQGVVSAEETATGGVMMCITLLASGFIIGPNGASVREGKRRAAVLAVSIICDAIDRYKELCEGAYCGQYVPRMQTIRGIAFSYQPPPRNIVPYAAALKGQSTRCVLCQTSPVSAK